MNFDLHETLIRLSSYFLSILPAILMVLGILIGGWIIGRIVGKAVERLTRSLGLETLLESLGLPKLLYHIGYKRNTPSLLGLLARWIVYLVTVIMVADVAGFEQVTQGLNAVVAYLPRAAVAILFLMVGVWGADMMRTVIRNVVSGEQGQVVGTGLYYGVIVITVALVADQLGLETSLINQIIVIVLAGGVLAGALAVGGSARQTLANVFARRYVARLYRTGDVVRLDDIVGVVKAHAPTTLVVVGEDITYNIPYILFMERAVGTTGEPIPVRREPVVPDAEPDGKMP